MKIDHELTQRTPSNGRGTDAKEESKTSSATKMIAVEGGPDLSKLKTLNVSLKEKLDEIKALDGEILVLVGDDNLDEEIS